MGKNAHNSNEKHRARDDAAKSVGVSARYVSDAKDIKKKEHVFKMNLLRRHLDPLAWGKAFKKLLKLKGVKSGSGKGNPRAKSSKAATVAALAAECGVSERTARERRKLADDYDGLPAEEQAKVDAGKAATGDQPAPRGLIPRSRSRRR